eukprot:m.333196 g.333196  ORF g.333196 m.333196 type:complete len:121 (+) comp17092_c0_seq1:290-652(+)
MGLLKGQLCPVENWKPDETRNTCRICDQSFGFMRWKHHCRFCGDLVCDDCSKTRATGEIGRLNSSTPSSRASSRAESRSGSVSTTDSESEMTEPNKIVVRTRQRQCLDCAGRSEARSPEK